MDTFWLRNCVLKKVTHSKTFKAAFIDDLATWRKTNLIYYCLIKLWNLTFSFNCPFNYFNCLLLCFWEPDGYKSNIHAVLFWLGLNNPWKKEKTTTSGSLAGCSHASCSLCLHFGAGQVAHTVFIRSCWQKTAAARHATDEGDETEPHSTFVGSETKTMSQKRQKLGSSTEVSTWQRCILATKLYYWLSMS